MVPKIFAVIFHYEHGCLLDRTVEIDATRDAVVQLMKHVEADFGPIHSLTHLYNEVGAKESFLAAMARDAEVNLNPKRRKDSTRYRDIWLNKKHKLEVCLEGTHLEPSDFLDLGL